MNWIISSEDTSNEETVWRTPAPPLQFIPSMAKEADLVTPRGGGFFASFDTTTWSQSPCCCCRKTPATHTLKLVPTILVPCSLCLQYIVVVLRTLKHNNGFDPKTTTWTTKKIQENERQIRTAESACGGFVENRRWLSSVKCNSGYE
jgi:hypothetical protein